MQFLLDQKQTWFRSILRNAIVAILYCGTGYLGLFLATPPGYATPIWLPSGIALGAVLVWGIRTLPGVFLGSLITNYFISIYIGSDPNFSIITGTIIAIGASLQAVFGWWLVKRFLGLNNTLIHPNDILSFAILSGPVSCLINSTWSNVALLILKILGPSEFMLNWTTWWVGDSTGVLAITPLFLILFSRPARLWRPRIVPIVLPLFISFAAVICVYLLFYSSEIRRTQAAFSQIVSNHMMLLENKLSTIKPENLIKTDLRSVVDASFESKKSAYNNLSIEDITTTPSQLIYLYSSNKPNIALLKAPIVIDNLFEMDNRTWRITASPSAKFINSSFKMVLSSLLVSGFLFCILMNIILFLVYGQKFLAEIEARRNKRKIRSQEILNLSILRSAGEGIYGVNNNGNVTFVNPRAAEMLGYEESEIIGKSMHSLIHHCHPDGSIYRPQNCPVYETYRTNKGQHVSNEVFWKKDGSCFWVDYTTTPLLEGDRATGVVVIFNDVSKRKRFEIELEHMAHYDSITDLPNRTSFFEHLETALNKAKLNQQMLAVCFIDLDNFKQINDTLGHSIGDQALKEAANLLKSQLTNMDYLARLGGDEFAVILENIQTKESVNYTMDRIIRSANKPISIANSEIALSMSIGVALYPYAGETPEEILVNADIAMYHAKDLGKGTYAFFNEEIHKQVKRKQEIDAGIRHAFENDEFRLVYQFIIDTNTLAPIGIEALLRWHSNELGNVPPSEFLPIVETNGLIQQVGNLVIKKACEDYKILLSRHNNPDFILSLNISVLQLENPNFIGKLKSFIHQYCIKPENVILEITELTLVQHLERNTKAMNEISAFGIRFALDDFGVSYTSMQSLKNLPIKFIKIDRSFTEDILKNVSDAEIVNATIQLSHGMGIQTIAEGVETHDQLARLKKMGCEYVQGYIAGKPADINVICKRIAANKPEIS